MREYKLHQSGLHESESDRSGREAFQEPREEPRWPKQKTPEQALAALMRYCSRAERSSGDAMRLMRGWNIADSDATWIMARLRSDRFVDDARFAAAYIHDKTVLAGWGIYKIKAGLTAKGVAPDIIASALSSREEATSASSEKHLKALLEKKNGSLKGDTPYRRKGKLMRLALSRGFEYDTAARICDEIIGQLDD